MGIMDHVPTLLDSLSTIALILTSAIGIVSIVVGTLQFVISRHPSNKYNSSHRHDRMPGSISKASVYVYELPPTLEGASHILDLGGTLDMDENYLPLEIRCSMAMAKYGRKFNASMSLTLESTLESIYSQDAENAEPIAQEVMHNFQESGFVFVQYRPDSDKTILAILRKSLHSGLRD